eukprot:jgi/Bigna1/68500/fgenesh1_pg.6_\
MMKRKRGASLSTTTTTTLFTDPQFPPCPSSLDGRRGSGKQPSLSPSSSSRAPPLCRCKKRARIRTVGKEGVNQGREFWSCAERDAKRRCGFFLWADSRATWHSSAILRLKWRRFGPPSYKLASKGGSASNHGSSSSSSSSRIFRSTDIVQGSVGDCWFLSAVAVVAERRPDLIRNIFFPPSSSRVGAPRIKNDCSLSSRSKTRIRTIQPGNDESEEEKGRYTVRLFLDGGWRMIMVDNFLPVREKKRAKNKRKTSSTSTPSSFILSVKEEQEAHHQWQLAYSKAPRRVIWAPILEKAYAKFHGSYQAISGGWVHEALQDLTGCPTESIEFGSDRFDSEATWARLLSFHQEGFPMGASITGHYSLGLKDVGLVGNHAYSILDVREVSGIPIGRQLKIEACFGMGGGGERGGSGAIAGRGGVRGEDPSTTNAEPAITGISADQQLAERLQREEYKQYSSSSGGNTSIISQHTAAAAPLRLVCVRNPWGRQEWTGEWARSSERWTLQLRSLLGNATLKNDGTFWMTYSDFLMRFSEVDVCKAHREWSTRTFADEGALGPAAAGRMLVGGGGFEYRLKVRKPTWCYIMLLQPTKRGRGRRARFYTDMGLSICSSSSSGSSSVDAHQRHANKSGGGKGDDSGDRGNRDDGEWACEAAILSGAVRSAHIEMILQPNVEYIVTPLVFRIRSHQQQARVAPFHLSIFSANEVDVVRRAPLPDTAVKGLMAIVRSSATLTSSSSSLRTSSARRHGGYHLTLLQGGAVALLILEYGKCEERIPTATKYLGTSSHISGGAQKKLSVGLRLLNMHIAYRRPGVVISSSGKEKNGQVPLNGSSSSSSTSFWTCPRCTFRNSNTRNNSSNSLGVDVVSRCEACGKSREPLVTLNFKAPPVERRGEALRSAGRGEFSGVDGRRGRKIVVATLTATCTWNHSCRILTVSSLLS